MSEERCAWVFSVPSVIAWAVAHAGRRVVPCKDDRLKVGDLVVIRARKGNPGSYEALEAYLGRPITNRPQCVIVATATLAQRLDPMPEDQGRWSHEPSWLLSKVRVLAEPVWYQRGGKPYPASDRLLGRARLQET